jgi:uncharacterized membrane protein YqjE
MKSDQHHAEAEPSASLTAGLTGLVKRGLGLLLCRLELAVLELSEARTYLLKLILVSVLAMVAACFALAYGTVLVVYLAWASLGWKILAILAVGFTAAASALLLYACALARQGKQLFSATTAELKTDRDLLL